MRARFRVQHRSGSQWEQVGWCRTWRRVTELIGVPARDPGWVVAEDVAETVRVHLRRDAEWRVVEDLTSKSPSDSPSDDPGR